MKYRIILIIVLLGLLGMIDVFHRLHPKRDPRPNIVVIMSDDQDDTGSMAIMKKTQELLAEQGVTFENSFVDFPMCCPSRAGFLTGQYSHNNKVWGNGPDTNGGYSALLPTEDNTLPVWLQKSGYSTMFIGKYLNGYELYSPHIPPGWDNWMGLVKVYRFYDYSINENGIIHQYGMEPADYQTDLLAQKATDYIQSQTNSSKPFFLWLAPIAPHRGWPAHGSPEPPPRYKGNQKATPLPQPPSFNEQDVSDKPSFIKDYSPLMNQLTIDRTAASFRGRREAILGLDDMVERVVKALKTSGKMANTIIVYTSDNGFFQGEHRRPGGKMLVYEESIRVPLVMSGPGIPKGAKRPQLVNNLDLVATILDLAQTKAGRNLDGKSFLPILKNPTEAWRSGLLIEGMDRGLSKKMGGRYIALRTMNYKYAEHFRGRGDAKISKQTIEEELYDLTKDPYELDSLHNNSNYTTKLKPWLQQILTDLRNCAGESCWVTATQP